MARIDDVVVMILARAGEPVPRARLHRLLYYCAAWHAAWEDERLFPERIEAWATGPIVAPIWSRAGWVVTVEDWPEGDRSRLVSGERTSIDAVLDEYAEKDAGWLGRMSRAEPPWQAARVGLREEERGDREIGLEAMRAYYGARARASGS